jgi:hypothetical protein
MIPYKIRTNIKELQIICHIDLSRKGHIDQKICLKKRTGVEKTKNIESFQVQLIYPVFIVPSI